MLTLILVTLYQNINFGDFCEGMADGLLFAFLCLLFILFIIVVELRDLYKLVRRKEKFDFYPLLFLVIFVTANWFVIVANENRFWKKIKYKGKVENIDSNAWIVLYEDNTFEVTKSDIEQRCTYIGKYNFENKFLILYDENIEIKTDNNFTDKYELISDSILQPNEKKYYKIKLDK